MHSPSLFHLRADPQRRIERRDRALENQRDFTPSQRAHLALLQTHQVLVLEVNASFRLATLQMKQSEDCQRQCALPASTLTNKPEHLSPPHFERERAQDSCTSGKAH